MRVLLVSIQDAALAATRLSSITDIAAWMSSSRLRLNPSKTVVIWLGSRQQVGKIDVHAVPILDASVSTVNTARDLAVVLDSELTMSAQVSAVCRSGFFFQLRQLRPVVRSLSTDATKTLVQAFISNRLD